MNEADFKHSGEEEETLREWSFVEVLDRPTIHAHFVAVARGVFQGLERGELPLLTQSMVADVLPTLIEHDPVFLGLCQERPRFHIRPSQRGMFSAMIARHIVWYNWGDITS